MDSNRSTPAKPELPDGFLPLFATLLLLWILLHGSLSLQLLAIGIPAALAIAWLFRDGLSFVTDFRFRSPEALRAAPQFLLFFFKSLVIANIALAGVVLSPKLPIAPGIVKARTRLKSRMGRLLLANAITLTPGTLTVKLDGEWIYVHCVRVAATDIEGATAEILAGFERYLEVMYG